MTVPTSLVSRPIAATPPVARHTAPPEISHPLGVLRRGQANSTSASSSTPLPSHPTATSSRFHDAAHEPHPRIAPRSVRSHTPLAPSPTLPISPSTPHISFTPHVARPNAPTPPVARPVAPTDVSHPHVTSRPERANGSSNSPSMPLPSHSTTASSRFHDASHIAHPHVAPYPVPSGASSAPPPTPPTLHSNVDISHAALSPLTQATSRASYPCVPPCSVQTSVSFASSPTPSISHSKAHISSPHSSPPRRKRSRRCFVCGGTGKHRLNPRFCPRTYELLSKHLATFDATFRLVSFDGSPLPMTRHPGGVAAHLLSPRRLSPRTVRVAPRSVSKSPGTSQSNPPHVHRAPHASPIPAPRGVPNSVPMSNLNPPQAPPTAVEHPRHVSTPDRSFESNPPHFLPVERLPSPPLYLPVPIHDSRPHPETPSNSTPRLDNAFILQIFDCLILSLSWRRALAGLIDAIDRLAVDADITALQKRVRERYKTFVPSI